MELSLADKQIVNSKTHSEKLFETCNTEGFVIRYDTITYRDQEVTILSDPSGVQCFARWNNELIDLGLNNIHYKEDICRFIDRRLDLITDFRDCQNFVGAKLEYFHNGDYRDIRLLYRGRILKVFLVTGEIDEIALISEAIKILNNSGLLEDLR